MESARELLVVIATYNERDSLPLLVEKLAAALPAAHILVIDDDSPDGTGVWCDRFAVANPQFEVIHRRAKLGLGSATLTGLKAAINGGYPLVATMDADLSHDPATLRAMLLDWQRPEMQDAGILIGSRYVPGGSVSGWPWYRRWTSRLVNWYARTALKLPARDNTSAFRIYRTEQLRWIDLNSVTSQGYAYLEEILLLARQVGIDVAEFPIAFKNRETGRSKVGWRELARSLRQIFKLSLGN